MYNLRKTLQEIVVEIHDLDTLPTLILKEVEVEDDFPSLQQLGVSPDNFNYLQ